MIDDKNIEKKVTDTDPTNRRALRRFDWIVVAMVALSALGLLIAPMLVTPYYRSMYEDFVTRLHRLPGITLLVTKTWFPLVSALIPLGMLVVGLSGKRHLYLRRFLLVAAFFISLALVVLYSIGIYAPVFVMAQAVSS